MNRLLNRIRVEFLIRYKFTFIGVIIGAIAGYAYYYFVGCVSGTCSITSKPLNSTLYGALMGGILFISNKKETSQKTEKDEN